MASTPPIPSRTCRLPPGGPAREVVEGSGNSTRMGMASIMKKVLESAVITVGVVVSQEPRSTSP
jgi:hypothetical protein